MKKFIVLVGLVCALAASVMPLTALGIKQGFQRPEKGWAPGLVYFGARIRMRFARYEAAAAILERAVRQWTTYEKVDDAYYWIALCHERSGSVALGVTWYKRFLAKCPHHRWSAQAQRRLDTIEAQNL